MAQAAPLSKISMFISSITMLVTQINSVMKLRAERRQAFRELNALTNYELNDIGICRAQIMSAVYDYDNFYADSIRDKPMEVNKKCARSNITC